MLSVDFIMQYEAGEIDDIDEIADNIQGAIDDGSIWQLQGYYGRLARDLIEAGYCHHAVSVGFETRCPDCGEWFRMSEWRPHAYCPKCRKHFNPNKEES